MIKRKGMTLIEISITLVIIAIISGMGFKGYSSYTNQVRVTDIETNAQIFLSDMQEVVSNKGFLTFELEIDRDEVIYYLSEIEDKYLSFSFDKENIEYLQNGFIVNAKDSFDGYKNPYSMYFCTDFEQPRVLFMSAGADGKLEYENYSVGEFGDDIVMLVKER
ncbi:MAG: prepilin-type N-terminal cleavage/methylation domain-containing protein [Clostridia bacterium]